MAEATKTTRKRASAKATTGRRYTPRKDLAKKDEKRLEDVTAAFAEDTTEVLKWAEKYGRKCLKVQAGLRATPAPIPPELGKEKAAKVREVLGIVEEPKVEPKAEEGEAAAA